MFKNYMKTAIRSILKHKGYSLINITGLAIGLTCSLLILLWVHVEIGYDDFHEKSGNIYRVVTETVSMDNPDKSAMTPAPLAPFLKAHFPGVLEAVTVKSGGRLLMKHDDVGFYETGGIVASPPFFRIFSFPFVAGDPQTAFSDPLSIIITKEMADNYFGDEDPINKTLKVENMLDFKVTGVLKSIPQNSHLRFNYIMSSIIMGEAELQNWESGSCYTYLLLHEDVSAEEMNQKIRDILRERNAESQTALIIQPLHRIHLFSDFKDDIAVHGDIKMVVLFSIVAFFVLIIACINFINITTARAGERAKEASVRKVVGATSFNLVKQYFIESALLTLTAFVAAMMLIQLWLPFFNALTDKALSLNFSQNKPYIGCIVLFTLLTGLVSGSYPAIILSSFQPVNVLKGSLTTGVKQTGFRKTLVIVQFLISTLLIIGTLSVTKQLNYLRRKQLGFNEKFLIQMPLRVNLGSNFNNARNALLQNPGIISVTAASGALSEKVSRNWGKINLPGNAEDEAVVTQHLFVDYDYISTMDIQLAAGRDFSRRLSTDIAEAYIVNEACVRALGLESPLGQRCSFDQTPGKIVGVVKDFHASSLHNTITPLALKLSDKGYYYMFIRINPKNISDSIRLIESIWEKYNPGYPAEYEFVDAAIAALYDTEERMGDIFTYFTALALIIACLGLFGMASFLIEKRTKEVGIRKVLGGSTAGIILLLSKDLIRCVLIANVIAWPLGYFVVRKLLQSYAYRTDIGLDVFLISGSIAVGIALLTVSYKSIRAALANPVESLRYE